MIRRLLSLAFIGSHAALPSVDSCDEKDEVWDVTSLLQERHKHKDIPSLLQERRKHKRTSVVESSVDQSVADKDKVDRSVAGKGKASKSSNFEDSVSKKHEPSVARLRKDLETLQPDLVEARDAWTSAFEDAKVALDAATASADALKNATLQATYKKAQVAARKAETKVKALEVKVVMKMESLTLKLQDRIVVASVYTRKEFADEVAEWHQKQEDLQKKIVERLTKVGEHIDNAYGKITQVYETASEGLEVLATQAREALEEKLEQAGKQAKKVKEAVSDEAVKTAVAAKMVADKAVDEAADVLVLALVPIVAAEEILSSLSQEFYELQQETTEKLLLMTRAAQKKLIQAKETVEKAAERAQEAGDYALDKLGEAWEDIATKYDVWEKELETKFEYFKNKAEARIAHLEEKLAAGIRRLNFVFVSVANHAELLKKEIEDVVAKGITEFETQMKEVAKKIDEKIVELKEDLEKTTEEFEELVETKYVKMRKIAEERRKEFKARRDAARKAAIAAVKKTEVTFQRKYDEASSKLAKIKKDVEYVDEEVERIKDDLKQSAREIGETAKEVLDDAVAAVADLFVFLNTGVIQKNRANCFQKGRKYKTSYETSHEISTQVCQANCRASTRCKAFTHVSDPLAVVFGTYLECRLHDSLTTTTDGAQYVKGGPQYCD